jgi:hypothetical protein
MKVILDECLPRRLIRDLVGLHQVTTVPKQGWGGLSDGELLKKIPIEFDVWITMDANLKFQNSIKDKNLAIIVLRAKDNRYETVYGFVPRILEALTSLQPGDLIELAIS